MPAGGSSTTAPAAERDPVSQTVPDTTATERCTAGRWATPSASPGTSWSCVHTSIAAGRVEASCVAVGGCVAVEGWVVWDVGRTAPAVQAVSAARTTAAPRRIRVEEARGRILPPIA